MNGCEMFFVPPQTRALIEAHPLTRRHPSRAYIRFVTWQFRSRLSRAPIVHDWVEGARFLVSRGDTGLTGNIYFGLHEFEDMSFLLHLLRPGDLFVDVGSNLGSYTILAARVAGSNCLSFEPVPRAFGGLKENVLLNGIESSVDVRNIALGSESGEIRFSTTSDTTNHVIAEGEVRSDAITVEISTVDLETGGSNPVLIKIDVEGYEYSVLRGAEYTLGSPSLKALIVEVGGNERYGDFSRGVFSVLRESGFLPYRYDPYGRRLYEVEESSCLSQNTVFIRDLNWAYERVSSARKFKVLGQDI